MSRSGRGMRSSRLVLAALLVAAPGAAGGQVARDSAAAAFDRADRTSRGILATVSCARRTGDLREQGRFGPVDSLGRSGQCVWVDQRPYGVFLEADTAFEHVTRFAVVDLTNGQRHLAPFDTLTALAQVRASINGLRRAFGRFQRADRLFAPVTLRVEADSIEVWLVPIGSLVPGVPTASGGEHALIYTPDGRTLAREIDAFDRHQPMAIPDTGMVVIESRERSTPLVSELVLANRLQSIGRPVAIRTAEYVSAINPGRGAVWVRARRP